MIFNMPNYHHYPHKSYWYEDEVWVIIKEYTEDGIDYADIVGGADGEVKSVQRDQLDENGMGIHYATETTFTDTCIYGQDDELLDWNPYQIMSKVIELHNGFLPECYYISCVDALRFLDLAEKDELHEVMPDMYLQKKAGEDNWMHGWELHGDLIPPLAQSYSELQERAEMYSNVLLVGEWLQARDRVRHKAMTLFDKKDNPCELESE